MRDTDMKIRKIGLDLITMSTTVLLISSCGWHDTTRVDSDFGTSVRLMVAEQIYDPEAAHAPAVLGPSTLKGNVADSAIEGYEKAAKEARVQRVKIPNSPIPVVGVTSSADE